ncbi:mitotic spindle checkpoint protein MAD1 isoform X1 [Morus notabilis]|uniref:mitotic spindle checkpoint protein MAD1 isoform X1 n=2 Tax=Morus notabilis TaxID=981085 RepID=UPI000CED3C7C|nr:mitotic spindle checkpoint protein MAD1 isoform X1 [Morus notabilis]
MLIRTPPPKRPRAAAMETGATGSPPPAAGSDRTLVIYEDPLSATPPPAAGSDRTLVIYEDPPSATPPQLDSSSSHQMLCTYQCRQLVKADFLVALSSAEKEARDCQSSLEAMNEKFSKVEAERKKYLDQFLYTEQELAAAKGREQSLQEQLLKDVTDSQERFRKQIESYSKLEVKLQSEMNLRMKAESSAASAEEDVGILKEKLSHLSESTGRGRRCLESEIEQLKGDSKLSATRISAELERMEFRANNAEKESQLLKEQLEDSQKQFKECLHLKGELEKKLSSFTFQEVTPSPTESHILVKHLQEELRNYEAEVREARKLKSSHENIELLKEKLLEEKGRRERAESELSKLQEIQLSMKKLEDELSFWKLVTKDIPGVSCSEDLPVKFAALQREVIDGTMKVGEVNARLKQLEVALDSAQIDKQKAEAEAALAKEKAEVLKSEVKQIQTMLTMVTDERDNLRNIVNELKKSNSGEAGNQEASGTGTLIQGLESCIEKKECYIKELETSLSVQKEANNCQYEEVKLLNERLNNEAKRIKSLERENDRLRSEISLLESKLGHGDFSAANTKVLRMVNTLAVDNEAKQTIEALRTELQKTKERLQAVEELKSQSGDSGKLVDSYISGKITQLKEQIATLEKREERYKTVFADRISVFRRACCEIFGYKIVMDDQQRPNGIPVTRFTLQSIYAQSDDEKLEFEYESGNTNILANSYSSQREISQQVEIYIRKLNSIPAFTANLTVESFNRRTLS